MQCTAKAKHTKEQCKAWAIRGKDKCKVHGGLTPCKHGRYSKYNPAIVELLARAKVLKRTDGLYDELAATMTMLNGYMSDKENKRDGKVVLALWERLDKLIHDLMRQEMSSTNALQGYIEYMAGRLIGDERKRFIAVTEEYLAVRR